MWFLVIDMTTDPAHLPHFYPLSRAQESGMRSGWRVKRGVTGLRFLSLGCRGSNTGKESQLTVCWAPHGMFLPRSPPFILTTAL